MLKITYITTLQSQGTPHKLTDDFDLDVSVHALGVDVECGPAPTDHLFEPIAAGGDHFALLALNVTHLAGVELADVTLERAS